ncbi:DUF2975 domain-containing protein [Lacticaseibacillus absianus]|uniref:DUF2975 domain-containing protein n=1 Tax=Lacticaseibacillus absianus TaxID=2729623 RepID=UPI0015CB6CAE|nr:DUF2975 domain-containing protein [Lacticaseibacillus absianus]
MNGADLVQGRTRTAVRVLKWAFGLIQWGNVGMAIGWPTWLILQARQAKIGPWLPANHWLPMETTTITITYPDRPKCVHTYVGMGFFVCWLIGIVLGCVAGFLMFRALRRLCQAIEAGVFFTAGNLALWRTVVRMALAQWGLAALGGHLDATGLLLVVSGYVLAVLFRYGLALQDDADQMI